VFGLYPPLHAPAPPATGRSRHPAIFLRHTTFSSPDGVDARTRRLHQTATARRPQHRSPRRSQTPAGVTVISHSTCHNHCDEVLGAEEKLSLILDDETGIELLHASALGLIIICNETHFVVLVAHLDAARGIDLITPHLSAALLGQ